MTSGQGVVAGAWLPGRDAEARLEEIRQALATTTEPRARSRLRVVLADQLAAMGDIPGAVGELRQALAEAPPSAGLWFVARAVGRHLPAEEAEALIWALREQRSGMSGPAAFAAARESKSASSSPARPQVALAPLPTRGTGAAAPSPGAAHVATAALAPWPTVAREPVAVLPWIEQAFAALTQGKAARALRLGEEVARGVTGEAGAADRISALVVALAEAGAVRESLRLARTVMETSGHPSTTDGTAAEKLRALIQQAAGAGLTELASRWSHDLAPAFTMNARVHHGSLSAPAPEALAVRYREAQRLGLSATIDDRDREAAITNLLPLLGGHSGAGDALRLAERLSLTGESKATSHVRSAQMLQAAFEAERSVRRRQRLAWRWANLLTQGDDPTAALVVLEQAINALPAEATLDLRRERLHLLRTHNRPAELCRALEADAELVDPPARREMWVELARLFDAMAKSDVALDVRLRALQEHPGDVVFLAPARQQLESQGQLDRSLELAATALPHVIEPVARGNLLRDVATLAEIHAGDRERAAAAWREVLTLIPGDTAAFEAAARLLRQLGAWDELGALLASEAARDGEPQARARTLWRLAEFRRVERQTPLAALSLYRQIAALGLRNAAGLSFPEDEWQRRDDALALHTARVLAAPDATEAARALAERAALLCADERWEDADRALDRALDLDPSVPEVMAALQLFHQRRGDWAGLRQRLTDRVERLSGAAAASLWIGIGQANQGLGDLPAAADAYARATTADGASPVPLRRLRELVLGRGDFAEAARLMERELALVGSAGERVTLSVELAALLSTRLDGSQRAVEILEAALVAEPQNVTALDALFSAALAGGAWEKAHHALEGMLAAGLALADTSQRYYRLGLAAEKAKQVDRALSLYSRSYARNPAFRPTLERLSEICFELQQWENAWKATEHLIERHGGELDAERRAELALRSAWADLHVAQRQVAANRIAAMMAGPASQVGLRDVAESWASMRFEPRLLAAVDGDRRARVLSRLTEVLALTGKNPGHSGRTLARETLAAIALVDRRWADALSALEGLGEEMAIDPERRCRFSISAGDILLYKQGDPVAAGLRYQRARALNPREPRLARPDLVSLARSVGLPAEQAEDQPTPGPIRSR